MRKDVQALVDEFVDTIYKQVDYVYHGEPDSPDIYGDRREVIARELLHGGEEAIDTFSQLLGHKSRLVRLTAAVHLLPHRTDGALAVITEIAQNPEDEDDLIAYGAQENLRQWKEHPEYWNDL